VIVGMVVRFPELRDDGTFTVRARFRAQRPDAAVRLEQHVRLAVQRRTEDRPEIFLRDFMSLPRVERATPETLDVVFDGRSGSRLWKDWVIALTQEVEMLEGVHFLTFQDGVSGRQHPGWPSADVER